MSVILSGVFSAATTMESLPPGLIVSYSDMANASKDYLVLPVGDGERPGRVICEDGHYATCVKRYVEGPGGWRLTGRSVPEAEWEKWTAEALATGERLKLEQEAKLEAEKQAKIAEIARILKEYPQLVKVADSNKAGHVVGAGNIRKELAAKWPGLKFSVTSSSFSGGNSIDVRWNDGPPEIVVVEFLRKYKEGSFNGMEDIYEYSRNVWPTVFGGTKYLSCERKISRENYLKVAETLGISAAEVHPDYMDLKDDESPMRRPFWDAIARKDFYVAPPAPPAGYDRPAEKLEAGLSNNDERDGYELRFTGKPSEEIRTMLKAAGWRWARFSGVWYIRRSPAALESGNRILAAAYPAVGEEAE